ncbi:MAG: DNA repair protein RadC [Bacteroidetes bacterium]|nr:MAG: DNA repair protein RadC [Bacteroidota bacterium]TAG88255.1 MAG: DNA repair protein RadC [Bacteroidota bacterium]
MENLTIKEWAAEDRPREKLLLKGKENLTDAELLAILLGTGTLDASAVELGKKILALADNDLHKLAKLTIKDLKKVKGIGEAKAITIIAALELGRRRKEQDFAKKISITSSQIAYDTMIPYLLDLEHEEFWIILVNRANVIIKIQKISQGGIAGTIVDSKMIFKSAIDNLASNLILVHNHPSGNIKPSDADISLTNKMIAGGKLLEINVLDHIIFTNQGYYSFLDSGMM